ncbi:CRAL-TRIO domain-containing protein [Pavlovales sp. CCMP2436]|nr:CRAL-TRIO domain-containing protein [Pavlovales sp. CCMP2436]
MMVAATAPALRVFWRCLAILLAARVATRSRSIARGAVGARVKATRLAELAQLCPAPASEQLGGETITREDLARFLRVHDWDVEKAASVLRVDYAWRQQNRPRALRPRDAPGAARQGAWRAPRDKWGWPVRTADGLPVTTVTTRDWRPNAYGRKQNAKHIAFCMEEMVRSMPRGRPQGGAAMLLDMSGFKPGLLYPYVKDGVDTCQRHYPCRLGAIIAFNLPSFFPAIWAIVQPWFNAVRQALDYHCQVIALCPTHP